MAKGGTPEERFRALKATYFEVAHEATGWVGRKCDVVKKLSFVDLPEARALMLRIVRRDRSHDVKFAGVAALGRTADLRTIHEAVSYLTKSGDPVLIIAFGDGLAASKRDDVRKWVATTALLKGKPPVLAAYLMAAGRLGHADAVPAVVKLYEDNAARAGAVDIVCRAVDALGEIGSADGMPTLVAASKHDDWRVRRSAAAALPRAGLTDERGRAAIRALFSDSSSTVKQTLAAACGAAKATEFTLPLVGLLEDAPRLRTRYVAFQALKRISGQDFGLDGNRWRRWIKEKDAGVPSTKRRTFAKYYGFSVYSDRVVFIVDISGSMLRPSWKSPSRIDVAKNQLVQVLNGLDPKTLFNILVFSTKTKTWQPREIEATPANVKKAIAWALKKMDKPDGNTHTYDALERAFTKNPAFDTIYLLSDGNPSDGRYWKPDGVLASVRHWNRHRNATVHTIALTLWHTMLGRPPRNEKPLEMAGFMKRLATSTGGSSKHVQTPPN